MKLAVCVSCAIATVAATLRGAAPDVATHTLFTGAEFQVAYNGGLYHVNDVVGSSFVIKVADRPVRVSGTDRSGLSIKMVRQLKLAPFVAHVDNFAAERAFATGTDPEMKAAIAFIEYREMNQIMQEVAMARMDVDSGSYDYAAMSNRTFVSGAGGGPVTSAATLGNDYMKYSNAANASAGADMMSSPAVTRKQNGADERDQFDALRVDFDVSSPREIAQPYVVLVGVFHDHGKPKARHLWIGARAFHRFGDKPQHFHFLQDGFPPGYELEKVTLHLYDYGGMEVATNIAEGKMELTREETFSYLLMDYLSRHKDATLPATPAMTAVPADWRTRVQAESYHLSYYVKVDKLGVAKGIYQDADCKLPITDSYLADVILKTRFRPALAKGRPIEGVAKVMPAALAN